MTPPMDLPELPEAEVAELMREVVKVQREFTYSKIGQAMARKSKVKEALDRIVGRQEAG